MRLSSVETAKRNTSDIEDLQALRKQDNVRGTPEKIPEWSVEGRRLLMPNSRQQAAAMLLHGSCANRVRHNVVCHITIADCSTQTQSGSS